MAKATNNGQCLFCKGTFSKQTMAKHLAACEKRETAIKIKGASRQRIFHLLVEGRYAPQYWIHLEASGSATLQDIDGLLRRLWLECCGHLSAFHLNGRTYSDAAMEEFDDEDINIALEKVLRPKMKFRHEYDFGTTTELELKVLAEREGLMKRGSLLVVARNEAPVYKCGACKKTATQICSQCVFEAYPFVCDDCAEEHDCGEEMLLPVVNSPRMGMCGYTG